MMENDGQPRDATVLLLSEVAVGQSGMVLGIDDALLEQALTRVGFLRGDTFTVTQHAPWGGPVALMLPGGKVALRKSDAQRVRVKLLG